MSEGKVEKRENKHAVIYFEPGASAAMKDLANKIRSEGGRTTLVWAGRWKGPQSILTEVKAVVVQKGCAKESDIVEAYRKFSHDVEIHYVDQDGGFVDPGATDVTERDNTEKADAVVPEPEADADGSGDAADDTDADSLADDEPEDVSGDPDGDDEDADPVGSEESKLED